MIHPLFFSRRAPLRWTLLLAALIAGITTSRAPAQNAAPRVPTPRVAPPAAVINARVAASTRVRRFEVGFGKHLFVDSDIALRGVNAQRELTFSKPRRWNALSGTALRLRLWHSEALLPDVSFLEVTLNGTRLRSIRLDKTNVTSKVVRVPLPPELLRGFNTLQLAVEQHYTRECEYPLHPSLWTTIGRDSAIEWAYSLRPMRLDLADFPVPLVDELDIQAPRLSYLRPQNPSGATLTAIARLNASFTQSLPFRPLRAVATDSMNDATQPMIVIGTPQEQPQMASLLPRPLPAHGGVLALRSHPSQPAVPLLLVTGRTPDDVLLAARALLQSRARHTLGGSYVEISRLRADDAPPGDSWPGYLPDPKNGTFTLADLGFKDRTVRGYYGGTAVSFRFAAAPNARFLSGKGTMTLRYSYSAALDGDLSTVEVRIGDVAIKSLPLRAGGAAQQEATFSIPEYLLTPNAEMTVVFYLVPRLHDRCQRIMDEQVWGTLHRDTSFSMPRDSLVEMPNLRLLAQAGFPFTRRADLGETAFVLPRDPSADEMTSLLAVAARLGTFTRGAPSLGAYTADKLPPEVRDGRDLIVIGTPSRQAFLGTIAKAQQPSYQLLGGSQQQLSVARDPYLRSSDFAGHGIIEEMISPWNAQRVLLLVSGRDDVLLERARQVFTDPTLFGGLSDDLALVRAAGQFDTIDTATQRATFGQVSGERNAQLWFERYGLILGAIILLLLFLVALSFFRPRLSGPRRPTGTPDSGGAPPAA